MGTKWDVPTIQDVAERAGVSPSTVNRVLAGRPRSERSRSLVEAAIADLGFVVHQKRAVTEFTCAVEGCGRRVPSSRVCGMHRERMRLTGTYADPYRPTREEALWARVEKSDSCWHWTGSINHQGYGVFTFDDTQSYAHRSVYELVVGPIPDGYVLDHVCHSVDTSCVEGSDCPHRRCCNPGHLEPVTAGTNCERAAARRLTCRRGHPWVQANIYIRRNGSRGCRACRLRHGQRVADARPVSHD